VRRPQAFKQDGFRQTDCFRKSSSWFKHIPHIRRIKLASSETKITSAAKPAAARVSQMLDLRNLVRNLPALQKGLEGSQSQLLRIIQEVHVVALLDILGTYFRADVIGRETRQNRTPRL
jgi:hypothetical protein